MLASCPSSDPWQQPGFPLQRSSRELSVRRCRVWKRAVPAGGRRGGVSRKCTPGSSLQLVLRAARANNFTRAENSSRTVLYAIDNKKVGRDCVLQLFVPTARDDYVQGLCLSRAAAALLGILRRQDFACTSEQTHGIVTKRRK